MKTFTDRIKAQTRVLTPNQILSFWSALLVSGVGLVFVPANPFSTGFLGMILISASIVGFSPILSANIEKPNYNLWERLKSFVPQHKFLTGAIFLGLLMLNPWITLVNGMLATLIDLGYPEKLNKIERRMIEILEKIQNFSFEQIEQFLKSNPGKSISFAIGAMLGLGLSFWLLPFIFQSLLNVSLFQFNVVSQISWWMATSFAGGYIPGVAIAFGSATFGLLLLAFPTVTLAVASGLAGNKIFEKILYPFGLKVHAAWEKVQEWASIARADFVAVKNFFQGRYASLKTALNSGWQFFQTHILRKRAPIHLLEYPRPVQEENPEEQLPLVQKEEPPQAQEAQLPQVQEAQLPQVQEDAQPPAPVVVHMLPRRNPVRSSRGKGKSADIQPQQRKPARKKK